MIVLPVIDESDRAIIAIKIKRRHWLPNPLRVLFCKRNTRDGVVWPTVGSRGVLDTYPVTFIPGRKLEVSVLSSALPVIATTPPEKSPFMPGPP